MELKIYRSLKGFLGLLKDRGTNGREMPVGAAQVFLELAADDGLTMTQVMQRTGQTQSSASRNSRMLTAWTTPKLQGLDLAEWRAAPDDFRSKHLFLNPKGKKLIKRITHIMGEVV
ncbi:hypothetical protein SAMN04487965_0370 [Microbulbifer donghaiensis]|uniref:MarR family transcriptional regulator n=1 Tax=Microbulbifer donghaiensis TaxID=494016 RepID=A0A1M4VAD9_9GAMM|nr:MarR family winged helix-turn-helix transcriptional regulator [Microbulbifer donghaiensis]SHE65837.1 hypothetical protein SAMN04487965_0370 [Microbulbifer donghaiensis]